MPRIGFVGSAYTDTSLADEECINLYKTSVESQGAVVPGKAYGGSMAQGTVGLKGAPGLETYVTLPNGPVRGQVWTGTRHFAVGGETLYEVNSDGTLTTRGTVANDGTQVSIAFSSIQLLIVSFGFAYCYDLAANTLTDVTPQLVGTPGVVWYLGTYFVVNILNTNKFQFSAILDGSTWPGLNVNGVSVFPENVSSIIANHNELWVHGLFHTQVYQITGNDDVFETIPGALIEKGNIAINAPCLLDNSVFWIDQDARGGRTAWRSNGYTPQRVSTHAVEIDWATYSAAQIAGINTFSTQIDGHLWWVIYIPNSSWTWVYDVGENNWFKLANWDSDNGPWSPLRAWNHVYANGRHLVGDWDSGNIYEMHTPVNNGDGSYSFVQYNGGIIRRYRRLPTQQNELEYETHQKLTIDMATGLGPQPPLKDGDGNDRAPQCMLRWTDDSVFGVWSNVHTADCGMSGQYQTRVRFLRLGRARRRVYEWSQTDPIPTVIRDAYLNGPEGA
jgi:hypothetical protein